MPPKKRPGPRTKAEKGEYTYARKCITIPTELWALVEAERLADETTSGLIQRLLRERVIPY